MNTHFKIALVVSHPIQHFCPQYVSFAENHSVDFKVFFASRLGLEKYVDINFNEEISWGNLNINKFNHLFLNKDAVLQSDKNIDAITLDNALDEFEPDIVITYGYFQKLQRRAYNWAVKNKVKLAYISDGELRQHRIFWKEFFRKMFLRRYFSKISYFLTVGDANEVFYSSYGVKSDKFIRMHFPIDIKTYKTAWKDKANLRSITKGKFSIPENEIVLACVGKLVSWKNQDHIIDVLKLLENEGIILNLLIIGSGEMMEQWISKAATLKKSKVHFTGFVDIQNLPAYYAACDIYIHPAAIEPHSIAISEAIYMGCPVVLSDRCGSYGDNDDIQIGKNGYVYRFGDIQEMAIMLKVLINDSEKRSSFGEYSHEISALFQQQSHFGIMNELRLKLYST